MAQRRLDRLQISHRMDHNLSGWSSASVINRWLAVDFPRHWPSSQPFSLKRLRYSAMAVWKRTLRSKMQRSRIRSFHVEQLGIMHVSTHSQNGKNGNQEQNLFNLSEITMQYKPTRAILAEQRLPGGESRWLITLLAWHRNIRHEKSRFSPAFPRLSRNFLAFKVYNLSTYHPITVCRSMWLLCLCQDTHVVHGLYQLRMVSKFS